MLVALPQYVVIISWSMLPDQFISRTSQETTLHTSREYPFPTFS